MEGRGSRQFVHRQSYRTWRQGDGINFQEDEAKCHTTPLTNWSSLLVCRVRSMYEHCKAIPKQVTSIRIILCNSTGPKSAAVLNGLTQSFDEDQRERTAQSHPSTQKAPTSETLPTASPYLPLYLLDVPEGRCL